MKTAKIIAIMGSGFVLGAAIGWLSAVAGASAAMRETLTDRDNYRDSHRATLQGVPTGAPRNAEAFVQMVKGQG